MSWSCRRTRRFPVVAMLLVLILVPTTALGRTGSLAVINAGDKGADVAVKVNRILRPFLGLHVQEPATAHLLNGAAGSASQPVQKPDKELVGIVERIRGGKKVSKGDLSRVGHLLGVDYLLMLRVKGSNVTGRLFSVHLRAYSANTFRGDTEQLYRIGAYVRDQATRRPGAFKTETSWWVWAIVAGLGALAIGMAIAGDDDTSGDLRIRVSR